MERPKLLIIAGPNGAGKTTVTGNILKHEWVEGCEYINPENYFIRLFFIGTDNPQINASRVAQRVMQGGHDVPIHKIISRYYKSIANCSLLSKVVDRLYVYDNSIENGLPELLFRSNDGKFVKQYEPIHEWAKLIYENIV